TSKRSPEYTGIPSSRDLYCRYRPEAGKYGRIYAWQRSGDPGLRGYRPDHGQKNDPGRGKGEGRGRVNALFRRASEKYCAMSGGFSDSLKTQPYCGGYSGKGARLRNYSGRSG